MSYLYDTIGNAKPLLNVLAPQHHLQREEKHARAHT